MRANLIKKCLHRRVFPNPVSVNKPPSVLAARQALYSRVLSHMKNLENIWNFTDLEKSWKLHASIPGIFWAILLLFVRWY